MALRNCFRRHAAIARANGTGFILERATWRASPDCAEKLGYSARELDDGDPVELGRQYCELRRRFGHINVVGGCCGTDHRHVEQICLGCLDAA